MQAHMAKFWGAKYRAGKDLLYLLTSGIDISIGSQGGIWWYL